MGAILTIGEAGVSRCRVRYRALNWFPILLIAHVALAVSLLAPSVALPFLLREGAESHPGAAGRMLMTMQGTGSIVIAMGLALTGAGLVISLGTGILTKPWLMVALAVYAGNLLLATFISRPNLRRLLRLSDSASDAWRRRARQARYAAYAMAVATGLIGFLMSTKPVLW
jgi:hypothetical protein